MDRLAQVVAGRREEAGLGEIGRLCCFLLPGELCHEVHVLESQPHRFDEHAVELHARPQHDDGQGRKADREGDLHGASLHRESDDRRHHRGHHVGEEGRVVGRIAEHRRHRHEDDGDGEDELVERFPVRDEKQRAETPQHP